MRFAYHKAVFRKALDLFKERSREWGRYVMGFVLRTVLLFGVLYAAPWLGDLRAESRLVAAIVASVVMSVFVSFVWDLVRAPTVMWNDLAARVDDLELLLRPKFSVLVNHAPSRQYSYGVTHRSPYTGSAQTVVSQAFNALTIDVTNASATTLEGCEAYLANFEESGGEPTVFNSMRLPWVPVGGEVSAVNIPPHGLRTVLVFRVVGNRVAFLHDQMPVQAVHMIKENGTFHGLITLSAKNTPSAFMAFRLTCIPDEPPHFSLIRRGFNEPEFIGWAPETFIGI